MPRVIFAPAAIRDLQRLREFLRPKSPMAARRAGEAIIHAVKALALQPGMGRPVQDLDGAFREWPIEFGSSGYVARYRVQENTVVILAIRHQREVGYSNDAGAG